jgi:Helix-turn-helix domain
VHLPGNQSATPRSKPMASRPRESASTISARAHGPSTGSLPGGSGQQIPNLNQIELARRWRISPRTLERWRWLKKGPAYIKLGGRVAYHHEDVAAFEQAQRRGCGS